MEKINKAHIISKDRNDVWKGSFYIEYHRSALRRAGDSVLLRRNVHCMRISHQSLAIMN